MNKKQGIYKPKKAAKPPIIDFSIKVPMYTDKLNIGPGITLIIENPLAKSN